MKKLKGYLFVGGVYQDEVKEGKVEVLILNAEKRWTAMSGTLKTENGRMVFEDIFKFEKFEFKLKTMPEAPLVEGSFDFCLGGYSDGRKEYTTTSFAEMVATSMNGEGKELLLTGFGCAFIEGACLRWYPMIFRNVEIITPRGFYVNGEYWTVRKKLVMRHPS